MASPSQQQPTTDQIQRTNWEGRIPVVVTLAPTSLSSPTVPAPVHVLLSRQTFLHLGLQTAIQRLHPFAPTSFFLGNKNKRRVVQEEEGAAAQDGEANDENDSDEDSAVVLVSQNDNEQQQQQPIPVCWFEDEATQLPLRWQLFAGVLYDLSSSQNLLNNNQTLGNNQQVQSESAAAAADASRLLPWRLRLHFTNYPSSVLLPMEQQQGGVEQQLRSFFSHSLKQAVTLRTGQNALQLLTKESHQTLWQSVASAAKADGQVSTSLYRQVAQNLATSLVSTSSSSHNSNGNSSDSTRIPVRLLVNANPSIQKSCRVQDDLTLGQLLVQWLGPEQRDKWFSVESATTNSNDNNNTESVPPTIITLLLPNAVTVKVNGIQPPLHTRIWDLWEHLCHVDYFLYISVVTSAV